MVEGEGFEPPVFTPWVTDLQSAAVTVFGYPSAVPLRFELRPSTLTVWRPTD